MTGLGEAVPVVHRGTRARCGVATHSRRSSARKGGLWTHGGGRIAKGHWPQSTVRATGRNVELFPYPFPPSLTACGKGKREKCINYVVPERINYRVPSHTARDLVRRLAQDSTNIRWSSHALERMEQRGITDLVVVDVLRRGELKGAIEPGQSSGEWKVKMVHVVKGRREVGGVVITIRNANLFIKTVEWEDIR